MLTDKVVRRLLIKEEIESKILGELTMAELHLLLDACIESSGIVPNQIRRRCKNDDITFFLRILADSRDIAINTIDVYIKYRERIMIFRQLNVTDKFILRDDIDNDSVKTVDVYVKRTPPIGHDGKAINAQRLTPSTGCATFEFFDSTTPVIKLNI